MTDARPADPAAAGLAAQPDAVSVDHVQLIETLRIEPGRRIPLLAGHRARLQHACAALGYAWPDAFDDAITQQLADLDPDGTYRLRMLVSRDGACDIQSNPLPPTIPPVRVRLAHAPLAADPAWLGVKATHRPWYSQPTAWLQTHPDVFDILYCNDRDEACEGSRSNLYIRNADGDWLTPPQHCGLLPGVQRQALLDQGLVREAVISRAQLQQASQIRVSNALRGWLDAILIDE